MKLKFFSVDALEPDDDQSAVDDFCTRHRLISIDKRFVERGDYCYWSICVTYLEPSSAPTKPTKAIDKKGRIDYRETLSPEDFDRYSHLRDLRRELAEAEGAPVYTVFSNAQLAKMVTERVNTAAALAKIEGVGDAKLEKYGAPFLKLLKAEFLSANKPAEKASDETHKD